VIHGTDKDLLTAALVLASPAGVSVSVAGRGPEAVPITALIAWALLEEALAGLLFLLALMVGSGRLRGSAVWRCAVHGRSILRRSAVLLPFAGGAFVAAATAAAVSLPLTLPLRVLSLRVLALRRSILGLRL